MDYLLESYHWNADFQHTWHTQTLISAVLAAGFCIMCYGPCYEKTTLMHCFIKYNTPQLQSYAKQRYLSGAVCAAYCKLMRLVEDLRHGTSFNLKGACQR